MSFANSALQFGSPCTATEYTRQSPPLKRLRLASINEQTCLLNSSRLASPSSPPVATLAAANEPRLLGRDCRLKYRSSLLLATRKRKQRAGERRINHPPRPAGVANRHEPAMPNPASGCGVLVVCLGVVSVRDRATRQWLAARDDGLPLRALRVASVAERRPDATECGGLECGAHTTACLLGRVDV